MSGYTSDALVRQGIEASRVAFIHKPFTPRALAEKIREVLESSSPGVPGEP
jgi:DNA-binding response OmpR family regulator